MPRPHLRPSLLIVLALSILGGCKAETPAAAATALAADTPTSTASAVTTAAAALNPLSSPRDEVQASMRKFIAARSYHASMEMEAGAHGTMRNQLEFVAPDRYRMTLQGLGTQLIIGDTMYMDISGKQMKLPLPAGTLSQWRDPAKLDENAAGMTVKALGNDTIDGRPARKYLIHHSKPQPSDVTMWIGSDDLPMQLHMVADAEGRASEMTMRYSRFNDPSIAIDLPK